MKHSNSLACSMILISFTIISCEKEDEPKPKPVASFTMSKTTCEVEEIITFTNSSEHATSYFWDFGDGNTSTEVNPTHYYSSDGTFTVKLTAAGDGVENSTSRNIIVLKPPAEVVFVESPDLSLFMVGNLFGLFIEGEVENIGGSNAYNVKIYVTWGTNEAMIELEPSTIAPGEKVSFSYIMEDPEISNVDPIYEITWDDSE